MDEDATNIYFLHPCAATSATWLHDKDVIRCLRRSAQILSTVAQMTTCSRNTFLYQMSHVDHPCTAWACESAHNYQWLLSHYKTLHELYRAHFDRETCEDALYGELRRYLPYLPMTAFSDPPLCMPDECTDQPSTDACYRKFYALYCIRDGSYKRRPKPYWLGAVQLEDGAGGAILEAITAAASSAAQLGEQQDAR